MKKQLLFILAFTMTVMTGFSQVSQGGLPYTVKSKVTQFLPLQEVNIGTPDMHQVELDDDADAKAGALYKIGRGIPVNLSTSNSGTWEILPDGSKMWRLKLRAPDALALGLYYDNFYLPAGSSLFLYNEDRSHQIGAFNSLNNPVNNIEFATEPLEGEIIILEYHQPFGVTGNPVISINEVAYIYRNFERPKAQDSQNNQRDFGDSDACQVNVNCTPEGTNWADEKRGVVRILVKVGASYGWCSGSLINNTNQDCLGYILTADHCSGEPTSSASTADLNQWIFYFNYEAPGCTDPGSEGTLASQSMTGCTLKAHAGEGGDQGSDFYLVLLNGTIPSSYNVYYNGWNRSATAPTSGVSIHHPSGDIKKISTYTSTLVSDDWNNSGYAGSHWRVVWSATTNGTGVTEGGSSGSPIFDANGYIVGKLTGGASYCTATTQPDWYGKFWYSWDQNTIPGTGAAYRLKDWLDPGNTGATTLAGTYAPCGPTAPIADFSANNTAPCVNSTVTFTDQSTGTPTSWAWTFSPTTITYTGGTSAASQNPQVQFTAAGTYTVTLVATNASGSDTETKTSYINVQSAASLPYSEDFENVTFPPTGITILNPDAGAVAWGTDGAKGLVRRSATGNTGSASGAAALNCFNYNTSQTETDALVIQPLSLVGASNPELTFKRAYKYYQNVNYYDELRVYVSTDCGGTYTEVYEKIGTALATNGAESSVGFTPSSAADWDTDTVNLSSYVGQNIVIKFEISNKYGQNLYIDDINVANGAAPSAAVTITASTNPVCSGSNVTFTASPVNGGTAPTYQWQVNSVNVGTNSPTYTTNTIANGDQVKVIMTSNLSGVTNSPATSNTITMTVSTPVTPAVSIAANPGTTICDGTSVTFTASPSNGGASPSYQWKVNGGNVGTNSSTFTSTTLNNSDVVTVTLTSNASCVTSSTANSNSITMVVNPIPATPTISQSGVILTSSSSTGNQWYLNGVILTGETGQTLTATTFGTYTVIVTENGCSSTASAGVVASTQELLNENMYSVYPNPNNGSFQLSFAVAMPDDYTVEIHNAIGQIVYTESLINFSGTYLRNYNMDEEGKGVYFISIGNSNGKSVKRIVIF